jgi:hypothetical protein
MAQGWLTVNEDGRSVTVAFCLIVAGLAVYHHWPSRLTAWVQKTPDAPQAPRASPPPDTTIVPVGNLNDAQAAIIAYMIAIALTHTEAAPLANALAWALAVTMSFGAIQALSKEYPSILPPPTRVLPASAGTGSGSGGGGAGTTAPDAQFTGG